MKATIKTEDGRTFEGELIETHQAPEKYKRYRANIDGYYWSISFGGNINQEVELGARSDDYRYKTRNYFKTKEAAQAALDKQLKIAEIRDRIEELNDGWKDDLDSFDEKWCIYRRQGYNCVDFEVEIRTVESWKYLKSEEAAQQLIEEFGDDLKVLFE